MADCPHVEYDSTCCSVSLRSEAPLVEQEDNSFADTLEGIAVDMLVDIVLFSTSDCGKDPLTSLYSISYFSHIVCVASSSWRWHCASSCLPGPSARRSTATPILAAAYGLR